MGQELLSFYKNGFVWQSTTNETTQKFDGNKCLLKICFIYVIMSDKVCMNYVALLGFSFAQVDMPVYSVADIQTLYHINPQS